MTVENGDLVERISNSILTLGEGDTRATGNILTAVTMLYNSLRTQAEADAMRHSFGLEEINEEDLTNE